MTTRTYSCDLCHDPILKDGDGLGLYWTGQKSIQIKPVKSVEHHICYDCFYGLINLQTEASRILGAQTKTTPLYDSQ